MAFQRTRSLCKQALEIVGRGIDLLLDGPVWVFVAFIVVLFGAVGFTAIYWG